MVEALPGVLALMQDGSWISIRLTPTTIVQQIKADLTAARKCGQVMMLTLCYSNNGNNVERILSNDEPLLKLLMSLRQDQTDGLPFIRTMPSLSKPDSIHDPAEFCGFADMFELSSELWTKRWIVVSGRHLSWSKSPQDRKVRGEMDLNDVLIRSGRMNVFDMAASDGSSGRKRSTTYVLRLVKPDRIVEICWHSIHLLRTWSRILKVACKGNMQENSHFDSANFEIEQTEGNDWELSEKRFHKFNKFSQILTSPIAFQILLEYLKRTHSQEGLLFWNAVHNFFNADLTEVGAIDVANAIFDEFIADGAPLELSVSCSERAELCRALKNRPLNRSMFNRMSNTVATQLEQEKFTDFRKSPYWRSIMLRVSDVPQKSTAAEAPDALLAELRLLEPNSRSPSSSPPPPPPYSSASHA